jgi:hypothetical protein
VSHRIILNRTTSGAAALTSAEEVSYNFEYAPQHGMTPQQIGEQVGKIQKHLEKAAAIAAGEPVE